MYSMIAAILLMCKPDLPNKMCNSVHKYIPRFLEIKVLSIDITLTRISLIIWKSFYACDGEFNYNAKMVAYIADWFMQSSMNYVIIIAWKL